jgi:hypothetical protein
LGGRASPQSRSRRVLGVWIRMRFTVISSASRYARARLTSSPGPVWGLVLQGTVRAGAAVGRHPKVCMRVESSSVGLWRHSAAESAAWHDGAAGPGPGAPSVPPGIGCGCRVRGSGRAGGPE